MAFIFQVNKIGSNYLLCCSKQIINDVKIRVNENWTPEVPFPSFAFFRCLFGGARVFGGSFPSLPPCSISYWSPETRQTVRGYKI